MTETLSPTTPAKTRQARVYAFPPSKNVRTVDGLLARYLDLWRTHGYVEAAKIFEQRYSSAIRRRLGHAGVPRQEIEHEIKALKAAMRAMYVRNLDAARARGEQTA